MREERTGWFVIAAVVAFVLIDIALVVFAMSSTRSAGASEVRREVLPALPTASITATPTPTPSAPAIEPDVSVAPLAAVLAAFDVNTAYRSLTGGCPETPAALEVTTDAGVTWTPVAADEARTVQAIAAATDVVNVVAADPVSCAPVLLRSFVQGADWQVTAEIGTVWHLDAGQVIAPGGASSTPCTTPVQVAARTPTEAAVLCDGATVSATTDAGATWSNSAPVPGAASVAPAANGYVLAVTGGEGCEGARVVTLSAALEPGVPGTCVPTVAPDGSTVLATAADGTVWLWSGDAVARSSDGGTTW
ncbi:WD40/YVTN/BNR-like repeat-containing protein [Agromyces albus]|uniref:WD40/YVTN/BNR-like repeat-containing protein n=1 Tax=Agromyces albus TaxID=205332 RepID=UPI0010104268|nr:sialidase family protein [Agromyces albus]